MLPAQVQAQRALLSKRRAEQDARARTLALELERLKFETGEAQKALAADEAEAAAADIKIRELEAQRAAALKERDAAVEAKATAAARAALARRSPPPATSTEDALRRELAALRAAEAPARAPEAPRAPATTEAPLRALESPDPGKHLPGRPDMRYSVLTARDRKRSSAERTLATGWLYKRGSGKQLLGRRNWKRRWFALDGPTQTISYYDMRDLWVYGHEPLGKWDVRGCRAEPLESARKAGHVEIIVDGKSVTVGVCEFYDGDKGGFFRIVDASGAEPERLLYAPQASDVVSWQLAISEASDEKAPSAAAGLFKSPSPTKGSPPRDVPPGEDAGGRLWSRDQSDEEPANGMLPAGWAEKMDQSSGSAYYVHAASGETTWVRGGVPGARRGGSLKGGSGILGARRGNDPSLRSGRAPGPFPKPRTGPRRGTRGPGGRRARLWASPRPCRAPSPRPRRRARWAARRRRPRGTGAPWRAARAAGPTAGTRRRRSGRSCPRTASW